MIWGMSGKTWFSKEVSEKKKGKRGCKKEGGRVGGGETERSELRAEVDYAYDKKYELQ